jgi:4-hydroxy-4-methyl-2-oxoglutarate aldolase
VVVGGVAIESGDVIIADNDGVVVIPRREVDNVIKELPNVRAAEADLEAKVKDGLKLPDFISAVLASGRVAEI